VTTGAGPIAGSLLAKVIKMRPGLTPIWRVSNAALCSFWVSMGEHRQAQLILTRILP